MLYRRNTKCWIPCELKPSDSIAWQMVHSLCVSVEHATSLNKSELPIEFDLQFSQHALEIIKIKWRNKKKQQQEPTHRERTSERGILFHMVHIIRYLRSYMKWQYRWNQTHHRIDLRFGLRLNQSIVNEIAFDEHRVCAVDVKLN